MIGQSLKRGQVSLEYLIHYGFVFLIIVLALLFLWKSGLLLPPSQVPTHCRGFSSVVILSEFHTVSLSGENFTGILRNDAGFLVNVTAINVSLNGRACQPWLQTLTLRPGEQLLLTVNCSGIKGVYTEEGTVYKAEVRISWTPATVVMPSTSVGKCYGHVAA